MAPRPVIILLENGWEFSGMGWGDFTKTCGGEFVFCTAMSGVEESLTDPSFARQVLVSTVSHVGNTGYTGEDLESEKIWAEGLVCRHLEHSPSSWRNRQNLKDWIVADGRFVVEGIDTREFTMILRDQGSQRGIVLPAVDSDGKAWNKDFAMARLRSEISNMAGQDLTGQVSCKIPYELEPQIQGRESFGYWPWWELSLFKELAVQSQAPRVAVWDFGVKRNTLRILTGLGMKVYVLPSSTKADELLSVGVDGILLSNGPGDPAAATHIHQELKKVLGKKPLFAICLGHQLVAHALGAKTYKMKFGHRGIHHPVVEMDAAGQAQRTWITSQNHGFAVDADSLPKNARVSFVHADDSSVEGLSVADLNCETVQFHPEAAPGTYDAGFLIKNFTSSLAETNARIRKL